MEVKTFEIRDRATFVPAIAVKLDPFPPALRAHPFGPEGGGVVAVMEADANRYLLARAGFGRWPEEQAEHVLLAPLTSGRFQSDPFAWGDRTFSTAHAFIREKWNELPTGSVVDVRHLLEETPEPCESERYSSLNAG